MSEQSLSTIELDGVQFIAPPGWTREVEHSEDGILCSMQSTGVTFAIVGIYPKGGDPDDLVEEALDSLRQEHPSLEVDDWDESDPNDPIQTLEAVFMSLDMVSYCWIRAWEVGERTVLAMVQSIEPEAERGRLVFRALCQSMQSTGESLDKQPEQLENEPSSGKGRVRRKS